VIKGRKIPWVGHVTHMGGIRYAYKMLAMKPEGKRQPWRTEVHGIWEGVIKIQPTGIKSESVDVIQIA